MELRTNNIFSNPVKVPLKKEDTDRCEKKKENQNGEKEHVSAPKNESTRLNDYDLNLLEEYAYKELQDDILKLEYNIDKLEKKLEAVNSEINTLESLNSNIKLGGLRFKRDIIENELSRLKAEYKKNSVSAGISANVSEFIKNVSNTNIITACAEVLLRHILPVFSKKYKDNVMVKDALCSLNDINTRVDELVKTQPSYGEVELKYEKLTAFLSKANHLQSKIISVKNKS